MPFGLKMSNDVFQMQMDQITDRFPGMVAIHGDICVYGKDTTEHDRNLLQFMKRATQQGLVLNSRKCAIHQSHLLNGTIFTAQGIKPDPAKVQAFQDLATPENLSLSLSLLIYYSPAQHQWFWWCFTKIPLIYN